MSIRDLMNVKSLASEAVFKSPKMNKPDRIRSEGSFADRDADGRRDTQKDHQESLSDEEFERVLKLLKEHKGIVDNHLKVEVQQGPQYRVAVISDALGKVIKKLPEYQLRSFLVEKERSTGHLLNKSA